MTSATDWVASLSPWPADGFGLERMQALLDRLGRPERDYDAVHVVGTKGKSTAARTVAALLRAEGVSCRDLHVAARRRLGRAPRDRRRRLRASGRASAKRRRGAGGDAVRDPDRRRAARFRRARGRRGGARGGARRPPRRDERRRRARRAADERRPRAHRRARRDARTRSRARSSPSPARLRPSSCPTGSSPRSSPIATCVLGGAREAAARLPRPAGRPPTSRCGSRAGSSSGTARCATAPTRPKLPTGCSSACPAAARIRRRRVDPRRQGRAADPRAARAGRRHPRRDPLVERAGLGSGRRRRARPRAPSRRSSRSTTRARRLAHARSLGRPVLVTGSLYLLADLAEED